MKACSLVIMHTVQKHLEGTFFLIFKNSSTFALTLKQLQTSFNNLPAICVNALKWKEICLRPLSSTAICTYRRLVKVLVAGMDRWWLKRKVCPYNKNLQIRSLKKKYLSQSGKTPPIVCITE